MGVTWDVARGLDDGEVEARLFRYPGRNEPTRRVAIDLPWVHRELHRTGVTLQQLWCEYRDAAAAGPRAGTPYGYSQFCDLYADFRRRADLSMRQIHRAGEKVFRFDTYKPSPDRRYLLSALTKTAPLQSDRPVHITQDTFKKLEEGAFREKPFTEKRTALLDWLALLSRQNPRSPYGADVPLNPATDYCRLLPRPARRRPERVEFYLHAAP